MNQFDLNLQSLIDDLPNMVADSLLTVGLDMKALIQQRIQEKGLQADGNKTPNYSPSYELYRKKKGRQTAFMDLTFTGEMWRSIGLKNQTINGEVASVEIGGRDEFTQNKIDINSEKRFNVLELSPEEQKAAQELFAEDVGNKMLQVLDRNIS